MSALSNARQRFAKEMDRQAVVLDRYIRMLLDSSLTEVLLANEDLAAAKGETERFMEVAPAAIARAADASLSAQSGSLPFRVLSASPHRLI